MSEKMDATTHDEPPYDADTFTTRTFDPLARYRELLEQAQTLVLQKADADFELKEATLIDGLYDDEQTAELRRRHESIGERRDAVQSEIHALERDSLSVRGFVTREMTRMGLTPDAQDAEEATNQRSEESAPANETTVEPLWPTLAEEALYGLAGEIVSAIGPYTEADSVAILLNVLAAFGNCAGATPHAKVGHDRHPTRLFIALVGDTSGGRKGTSWSTPRYTFSLIDPEWTNARIKSGLSSGEGLIHEVRDPRYGTKDGEQVCLDTGAIDKRVFVIEQEFASVLTVMKREGNTLSATVRQAWDSGDVSTLTKNNPLKATGAHISIIGHITKQELLARLDDTSRANGFANRFLWALVRRSKELPEGGAVPDEVLLPLADRLSDALTFARSVSEVKRDDEARALWASVYHDLSEGKPGLLGAVLSRAEAQVLRLSVVYALLDQSAFVRVEHLRAALALWEYCERSAVLIFGDRLGDPTADRILEALRHAGPLGMSEKQIYSLFGGHKSTNERARALNLLAGLGLARSESEETGGRPRTVWKAAY